MVILEQLERPAAAALPNSYFWTWDHSTNWVLDDPGNQTGGCSNTYLKRPETFVEDYRRLTDFAAALGVKGIAVFGFLRDSHGGVEYARRVAAYGASRGVDIMPGLGITAYGGPYYEGDHRFNLDAFLRKNPDAVSRDADGAPSGGACPLHPAAREWMQEGLRWLFREFAIGGLNLENGDWMVDYHPLTQERRRQWPAEDPEAFFFQGLAYGAALEAVRDRLADHPVAFATYTGFTPTPALDTAYHMGPTPPAMLQVLPPEGVCQWTLSTMLRDRPLPLTAYLDDGAPAAALDNPNWPAGLRPPSRRSIGFVHQGSQWHSDTRHNLVFSEIKEACLRAWRAGMEGVGIHGEVSALHVPYALNYLAFSHFIHWPEDSLREFGRKTLGQVMGSEQEGELYAEALAHWHAGTLTPEHRKRLAERRGGTYGGFRGSLSAYERYKLWRWLWRMSEGMVEAHTASFQV